MVNYYESIKPIKEQETKEKERAERIRSLMNEALGAKTAAADAQAKAAAESGTKADRIKYYANKYMSDAAMDKQRKAEAEASNKRIEAEYADKSNISDINRNNLIKGVIFPSIYFAAPQNTVPTSGGGGSFDTETSDTLKWLFNTKTPAEERLIENVVKTADKVVPEPVQYAARRGTLGTVGSLASIADTAGAIGKGIENAQNGGSFKSGFTNYLKGDANNQAYVEQQKGKLEAKRQDKPNVVTNALGDLAESFGYMIPSLAASVVSGAAGIPAALTKVVSATPLATSGFASGTREALKNGASENEALAYGALSALIESAGEYAIGGVLGKGGGLIDTGLKKLGFDLTKNIANPAVKSLVNYGKSALGEGAEEVIQEALSVGARRLTYDENARINAGELAYAGLLGSLMGGIGSLPSGISNTVSGARAVKDFKTIADNINTIAENGGINDAKTLADGMRTAWNGQIQAIEANKTYDGEQKELAAAPYKWMVQELDKLTSTLVSPEFKDAAYSAPATTEAVNGGELTKAEALEKNKNITDEIRNDNTLTTAEKKEYIDPIIAENVKINEIDDVRPDSGEFDDAEGIREAMEEIAAGERAEATEKPEDVKAVEEPKTVKPETETVEPATEAQPLTEAPESGTIKTEEAPETVNAEEVQPAVEAEPVKEVALLEKEEAQTVPEVEQTVPETEEAAEQEIPAESKFKNDTLDISIKKHTKTGADLIVGKLAQRLPKEQFTELNKLVKEAGGYYSVPQQGFVFKSDDAIDKLRDVIGINDMRTAVQGAQDIQTAESTVGKESVGESATSAQATKGSGTADVDETDSAVEAVREAVRKRTEEENANNREAAPRDDNVIVPSEKEKADNKTVINTGNPLDMELYHGEGTPDSKKYASGVNYPVLGKGTYYAFSSKAAAFYGTVTKKRVRLKKAYAIHDDHDWSVLIKEIRNKFGGWKYMLPSYQSEENAITDMENVKKHLTSQGYDGVVVQYEADSSGDYNNRTRNSKRTIEKLFGGDQVVDYNAISIDSKPVEEIEPEADKKAIMDNTAATESVTEEETAEEQPQEAVEESANETSETNLDTEQPVKGPKNLKGPESLSKNAQKISDKIDDGASADDFKLADGKKYGFDLEQREYIANALVDGLKTDAEEIHVEVPRDGTLDINNNTRSVATVLDKLGASVPEAELSTMQKNALRYMASKDRLIYGSVGDNMFITDGTVGAVLPKDAADSFIKENIRKTEANARAAEIYKNVSNAEKIALERTAGYVNVPRMGVCVEISDTNGDKYVLTESQLNVLNVKKSTELAIAGINRGVSTVVATENGEVVAFSVARPESTIKDEIVRSATGSGKTEKVGLPYKKGYFDGTSVPAEANESVNKTEEAEVNTSNNTNIKENDEDGKNADNQGTVQESVPDRQGDTRVLDEVEAGDVQGTERGRKSVGSSEKRGRETERNDNRTDAERTGRGSGEGDSESGNIRTDGVSSESKPLDEEVSELKEQKSTEKPKGSNFVIGDSLDLPSGEKSRYKANVEAIRLVKQLMAEDRYATPEEQTVLSKYVGWGGLANAFDESKSEWSKEYAELKEVLSEEEYKLAKESTLNAHYTDISVIKAMYDGLKQLGFNGGRMLEPASGVGNFVGAMPTDMSNKVKSWTMIELDSITGQIAKYLYPNANVKIQGFEKALIPDNYMDVAISNVPFGNYSINDKKYPASVTSAIHNYFFAKALDKVRPGGIVMFITSSYTMNARDTSVRRYIAERADLIGAIRLPDTAFKTNAGTKVVTDILVLKKREAGTPYAGENFLEATWQQPGAYINQYFADHPEMALGTPTFDGGMYRGNSLTYKAYTDRGVLSEQIRGAFKNINAQMDYPAKPTPEQAQTEAKEVIDRSKQNGFVEKDHKIYRIIDGELTEYEGDGKTAERIRGMLRLRNASRELLNLQIEGRGDKEIEKARKTLNDIYDKFVKINGYVNAPANKNAFRDDPDSYSVYALENWDSDKKSATKSDIFTKNTVSPNVTVTSVSDVKEGLIVSVNRTGGVDVSLISSLTGMSVDDVTNALIDGGFAYKNKDEQLETAESYLSGNVRAKLREAETLANVDDSYKVNVEALKKVVPKDIDYSEIYVNPGTTWIPDSVYSDFAAYMLDGRNSDYRKDVEIVRTPETGTYTVQLNKYYLKTSSANTQKWGTARRSFIELLDAMLNSKSVVVRDKLDDGTSVINKDATAAANEKVEAITKEFQEWLWRDEARRTELASLYNEVFNSIVTPKYNGENLTVNGSNAAKPLREHQKNAVQRIIASGGNTLLAHRVGAGKTYEMAAAAMKLKELGLVNKPMFVVPKSLVAQWGVEFTDFFPAAKLLVAEATDFTPANRKVFMNRIANGTYDAVIVSYEQFEKLPVSSEYETDFYENQINKITQAIDKERMQRGKSSLTVKDLVKKQKQLQTKLEKLRDKPKDEGNISFEELGVDSLFVDEAHNFKNLMYTTSMTNVSGLGNKDGSKRAFDLYMKVRYLQQLNGGRGIVFATATPVMNSMSEMYIMQEYLQPDLLDQLGLDTFDAWAKQFGEIVNGIEIKPSGQGYRVKQSFSRFKNLNELQLLFRNFADVLTEIPGLKIPKMKGGAVNVVVCEPGEYQQNYMKELEERADNVKSVDPSVDNMLKITSDGRKISYTQRMIDPSLPYEEDCKIYRCADNVISRYKDSSDIKGTQLIFCDMATPKGKSSVTESSDTDTMDTESVQLYDDIKARLVKGGIPAKEIAFIHEADTDAKKKKLFADVNDGKVRVLIGSTGKMGVGMNAQKRVVAIHHLDAPWRPGDVEQRNGRAYRQGNINEEVECFTYVTEGSFDARLWDILERKQNFINQIMNGENVGREAEDTGEVTLSAAEVKALASGNPLIKEQVELDSEIKKLESLYRAHNSAVSNAKNRLRDDTGAVSIAEQRIENTKADVKAMVDNHSEGNFLMTIGGKKYTDKKEAGAALMTAAEKKAVETEYTSIGSFCGFDMRVIKTHEGIRGTLMGKQGYPFSTYPNATTQMINQIVSKVEDLPKQIKASEIALERLKSDIVEQEKIIASPFAKQAELDKKRARYNEIMAELNPSNEQSLDSIDESSAASDNKEYSLAHDGIISDDEYVQELIDNVISPRGISIVYDVDDSGVNAWYSSTSNTLHLNPNTKHSVTSIFGHELYHSLSQEDQNRIAHFFKTNSDTVSNEFKAWKKEIFELYEKKYAEDGKAFTDPDFWREYAAINCESLLTDKQLVERLCGKSKTLGQRILDWIKNAWYTITGKSRYTTNRAVEAGKLTEKALRKAALLYSDALGVKLTLKEQKIVKSSVPEAIASDIGFGDDVGGINYSLEAGADIADTPTESTDNVTMEQFNEDFESAKVVPKSDPWYTKGKNALGEMFAKLTRADSLIPEHGVEAAYYAPLRRQIIRIRDNFVRSQNSSLTDIMGMMTYTDEKGKRKALSKDETDKFTRLVYLNDLAETAKIQRERGEEVRLPKNYSEEDVHRLHDELMATLTDTERAHINEALEKRAAVWKQLTSDYIKYNRMCGFDVSNRISRQAYYRHQVIDFMTDPQGHEKRYGKVAGMHLNDGRSFLKRRTGSERDINTDFASVEFLSLQQMYFDTEVAKALAKIKDKYDKKPEFVKRAKAKNQVEIDRIILREAREAMAADMRSKGEKVNDADIDKLEPLMKMVGDTPRPVSETNDQIMQYNRGMARSISQLTELANAGELDGYANTSGHRLALEQLKRGMINETVFDFMSEFVSENDNEAAIAARVFFKNSALKRQYIEEKLGDKFMTWERIAKDEGYVIFQPREGRYSYNTNALDESAAKKLAEQIAATVAKEEAVNLSTEEWNAIISTYAKQIRVMGQPYEQWAVKPLITQVLNKNAMEAIAAKVNSNSFVNLYLNALRHWKGWVTAGNILRAAKYHTRNIIGDLEATLTADPGIMRMVPKAYTEIRDMLKNGKETDTYREWLELGGDTNLIGIQEMTETERRKYLPMFAEDLSTPKKVIAAVTKPFDTLSKYGEDLNRTRESVLRYASYLYYKDKLTKSDGRVTDFVASNRNIINGLDTIEEKAYQLSADALGNYADISEFGRQIRRGLIPFYSFTESNLRRYYRFFANPIISIAQGDSKAQNAKNFAKRMATPAVSAVILALINGALNREADEKLPEDVRNRPHITFGEWGGNVYAFTRIGNIPELLEWVGLDDWKWTEDDWQAPIDKMWDSITPAIKVPFELATGESRYSDFDQPSAIRDRWEYLFNTFGLSDVYKGVTGKPVKNGLWDTVQNMAVYKYDTMESAYWDTIANKRNWQNQAQTSVDPTPKSNALYYMKQAIRYGEADKAKKYMREYFKEGGTGKGIVTSINTMNPYYGFTSENNKEKGDEWVASLNEIEREKLESAVSYYNSYLAIPEAYKKKLNKADNATAEALMNTYIDYVIGAQKAAGRK